MHDKQAYEQTVTRKLEALPVPDMADAIWIRIEAQLDLDMPEDDGGGNSNPPSSPRGGWIGKAGIFLFVTALVLSFFLFRSRNNNNRAAPATTITNKISGNDTVSLNNTDPPTTEPRKTIGEPQVTTQAPGVTVNPLDTLSDLPANARLPAIDTSQLFTGIPLLPVKTVPDTVPLKQKGRGIKGITDDDYRIKPKNDSTP